jgi:hypothetical protein
MSKECRILIFSDVVRWSGYKRLVLHHKPKVILLAGDLTSDGFAAFRRDAFERIPAFTRKRKALARKFGVQVQADGLFRLKPSAKWEPFSDELRVLEQEYAESDEFHAARKALHIKPFLNFLRFAGKAANVFLVKGDHDDDFPGDYDSDQINSIDGCMEISGKLVEARGLRFLGLGFNETHYKRTLCEFVKEFRDKVDVVVAHSEQSRLPILGEFRPRLIARGHFGFGRFLINDIPSVFTGGNCYSLAEIGRSVKITQYRKALGKSRPSRFDKADCSPWLSDRSEFEMYPWLKPYSGD